MSLRTGPAPTRRRTRLAAMTAYVVLLAAWCRVIGVPNDPAGVVLWFWAGTVAWDPERPFREHLVFWRDWWRPLLLIAFYWLGRGLADEIGVAVHYTMPIRVDAWLGGGTVPTVTLQHAWCGDPCLKTLPPRWYDVLLTTVYASHFVTAMTVAGALWVRSRTEWVRWLRRYITLLYAGLVIYAVYPMAPPWMAARDGYLAEVSRVSSRGWSGIDLHRQSMVMMGMSNKVAAMPSLHAGVAFLLAFYAIGALRSPARWLLLLYPLAMTTALVYSGEHYVVDAVCGAVLAGLVILGCRRWESVQGVRHEGAVR